MAVSIDLENRAIIIAGVGPGLGLALTKYLLTACNATVIALSNDGGGCQDIKSRFSLKNLTVYEVNLTDEEKTKSLSQ